MLYLSPLEQDTFDMLLKPLFYAAASLMLLGSCDEAPATKTTQTAAKPATPVQETAAAAAPDFVNGITEANAGSSIASANCPRARPAAAVRGSS